MDFPNELIEQFARNNGAIFVGAGLSMGAGLPGWDELINSLSTEISNYRKDASYQDIAAGYIRTHGRNRLVTKLKEKLDSFHLKPTSAHKILVKLPVKTLFTTNYDDLIEQALRSIKLDFKPILKNADASGWDTNQLKLIKLHGDLNQPDSIVITKIDYDRYFHDHPFITKFLEVTLTTNTILFLGYSLSDQNILQLLSNARVEFGELARNHFIISFNADKCDIEELEERRVQTINLSIDNKNLFTKNLTKWLSQFHNYVQKQKSKMQSKLFIRYEMPLPTEPYKFLDYFTYKDTRIFCGRESETERLIGLILTYPFCILYGESGTGKTSLLQASVLPILKIEKNYKIVYTRPYSEPINEVKSAIIKTLGNDSELIIEGISLRNLVESILQRDDNFLLVLDQFEEFFIRQGPMIQKEFIRELIDLLNIKEYNVHCLISLRSEYLHRLDEINLPFGKDPLSCRFKLHELGSAQANAAIIEPAQAFNLKIEQALLERLLIDLKQIDIAPSQLQIVCYSLWQDWVNRGKPDSGLELKRYLELGETNTILANYLDNVIEDLEQSEVRDNNKILLSAEKSKEVARAILKSMITSEMTKLAISIKEITQSEIINKIDIDLSQAKAIIEYLRNKRVIRLLPDAERYELSHEVMIEKVWKWINEEERSLFVLKDRLKRASSDYRGLQELLPAETLYKLNEIAKELKPNEEELELILVSAIEHNVEPGLWVCKMEKEKAIEILAKLLESPKRTQLPKIAEAFGYTASPKAIRYLQELLKNKDEKIQKAAAEAFAKLSLSSSASLSFFATRTKPSSCRPYYCCSRKNP